MPFCGRSLWTGARLAVRFSDHVFFLSFLWSHPSLVFRCLVPLRGLSPDTVFLSLLWVICWFPPEYLWFLVDPGSAGTSFMCISRAGLIWYPVSIRHRHSGLPVFLFSLWGVPMLALCSLSCTLSFPLRALVSLCFFPWCDFFSSGLILPLHWLPFPCGLPFCYSVFPPSVSFLSSDGFFFSSCCPIWLPISFLRRLNCVVYSFCGFCSRCVSRVCLSFAAFIPFLLCCFTLLLLHKCHHGIFCLFFGLCMGPVLAAKKSVFKSSSTPPFFKWEAFITWTLELKACYLDTGQVGGGEEGAR